MLKKLTFCMMHIINKVRRRGFCHGSIVKRWTDYPADEMHLVDFSNLFMFNELSDQSL